jgi:hypothetical protein
MTDESSQPGALPSPPSMPEFPRGAPPPVLPGDVGRRRQVMAAAGAGLVLAAVAAAVITVRVRDVPAATAPAPVTVTVPAGHPTPVPLPAAEADRETCLGGWIAAGHLMDAAEGALKAIPAGMRVTDPAVRADPNLAAAVGKSAQLNRRAADTLESQIAPGATPILAEASHTAVKALRLLAYADANFDPAIGRVFHILDRAANQMGVLCTRLAP